MRKNLFTRLAVILTAMAVLQGATAFAAEPNGNRDAQTVLNGIRLKRMTQDLKLTSEQQAQVKVLLEQEAKQITALQTNTTVSLPEKLDKQDAIKKETMNKIRPLLTDDQRQKWQELAAKVSKKKKPDASASPATTPEKSAEPAKTQ